jgi:hypothetical protein
MAKKDKLVAGTEAHQTILNPLASKSDDQIPLLRKKTNKEQ